MSTNRFRQGNIEELNILVVEDDEDTRDLLRVIFEAHGARVAATSSVREALAAYDASRPDVIVADIGLPEYNGYTLIGRIRARDRKEPGRVVPAIALTAYATALDRDTVLSTGFQSHLPKPFEPQELIAIVADLAVQYGSSVSQQQ